MDQLAKIAAHIPGIVYQFRLWPDGRSAFPYASQGIWNIYGVRPEAVRNDASTVFAVLHPDDLEAVSESIQTSARELSIWRKRYRVCHPDGRLLWVEGEASPERLSDGSTLWHGYIRDITEHKSFEQELKQSSARYHSVIKGSKDGFAIVNLDGIVESVNDVFCGLLGYTDTELVGMNVTDFHYGEKKQDVRQRIQAIIATGGAIFDAEYQCKDGSLLPVEISVGYSELTPTEFFVFIRDVRTRRLEQGLAELRAALAQEVMEGNHESLLRIAVDTAERITHSESGFFHFFDQDKQTINLSTWSTATIQGACGLKSVPSHYPLDMAGVWAEAVRKQQPVVLDLEEEGAEALNLPFGHAPLYRGLFFPVIRSGEVVAILGVGNKFRKYDDQDLTLVSQIAEVAFDYVERSFAEQQVQKMAFYDPLTDLPNRRLLTDRLEQSIARARRESTMLAVCYLDIDNFKPVNDKWGHQVGDQLLKAYTSRLKSQLREVDTLARIGGDEFVIVLTNIESVQSVDLLLKRILKASARPFRIDKRKIALSVSIGVTFFPNDDLDSDGLIRDADHAMYTAKSRGRNTYEFYDPKETRLLQHQRDMIEELEFAIETRQLVLHFQPRIALQTGKVAGFEVLIRWQHPERGLLYPDQFLPVVRGTHLEWEIDRFVLLSAIAVHKKWRNEGLSVDLSVNLTSSTLQLADFPERLAALFGDEIAEVAPSFELEVLEQASIEDMDRVAKVMLACVELGVRFSLDDFGTGFSSLSYFHNLPIEIVKIDQSFVRNILLSQKDHGIVEGVLRLASAIDRPVVAEGVETIELGLMVALSGCRYAQGYGIARPMAEEAVLDWLKAWSEPGNEWLTLRHHFDGPTNYYDLNTASFSYELWAARLARSGSAGEVVANSRANVRPAAFEEWLGGIGAVHYRKLPQWERLNALHELNRQAVREMSADAGEDRLELLKAEFQERCQDVERLLIEIGEQLTSEGRNPWS